MLFQNSKSFGLTNNQLKILAMLSMLADHVGLQLLPGVLFLRIFGRLAFPIFAYMIAEGCAHTRHRSRYLLQILGLGLLCQAVYTFAMQSLYMGILLTFSLSILLIYALDFFLQNKSVRRGALLLVTVGGILFLTLLAPMLWEAQGFAVDYGALGVLLPVFIYFAPNKLQKLLVSAIVLLARALLDGELKWFALLALPFLWLYNGRRGKLRLKYLFYIFYPAHLVIIQAIAICLAQ